MRDNPEPASETREDALCHEIAAAETRKLRTKRRGVQGIWLGLGMFGLIGWSIAIPTLMGTLLGVFIDEHYPGVHSWTLTLLIIGLFIGCLNAWHWVAREEKAIREDEENKDE
jgi:ATP synthase protein I